MSTLSHYHRWNCISGIIMDTNNYIVIGHYHGKSIWSKFIKLRSWWKSPITHTAALSKDLQAVYEAWKKGCVKHHWNESHHVPGTRVEMFYIPCTEEQEVGFYQFLEMTKGAKYDFIGVIFGFLAQVIRQDDDKYFCTEWVETALREVGLCFQDRLPANKLTPSMAYISPIQKYKATKFTP